MDRWNESIKHWCRWLGNWVRIRRLTGLSISQSWCMLTTPWDWPSLVQPTLPDVWVMTTPVYQLLFSHSCEHRKMPACQSLCCWLRGVTAQSLQRGTSAVLIWGWKAEMILWLQGQCHFTGIRWPGPGKSQCLQREEKGERPVGGGTMWSRMLACQRHPFIPHEEPADQMLLSPHSELTSFHHPHNVSFFMYRCTSWVDKVHHPNPGRTYLESEWEWESTTKCKVSAAGPASDR